jgi:hypothetical protein
MGAPEVVYTLPDGLHRCWSAHHAVATDIDLRTARCVARHRLTYGKGPAVVGDQVVVLQGEREDDTHAPDVWDIRPTHLVAYDRYTLTELWRTTAPGHGIEVLGQDRDGRITVACHSTVTVIDPCTGGVEGVYRHPGGIGAALLMPEHNTVLLKNRAADRQALTVLRWRPDPRVATVTDTGGWTRHPRTSSTSPAGRDRRARCRHEPPRTPTAWFIPTCNIRSSSTTRPSPTHPLSG